MTRLLDSAGSTRSNARREASNFDDASWAATCRMPAHRAAENARFADLKKQAEL
jgi:uncharacterized hydantoinase/oxoprolinase family protein